MASQSLTWPRMSLVYPAMASGIAPTVVAAICRLRAEMTVGEPQLTKLLAGKNGKTALTF